MAFVNEIMSDEDRAKFKLDEIVLKRGGHKQTQYGAAIDRDRKIFLFKAKDLWECDCSRKHFVLWIEGVEILLALYLTIEELEANKKFIAHWKLIGIDLPSTHSTRREEIVALIKEALTVYGTHGPSFWGNPPSEVLPDFDF